MKILSKEEEREHYYATLTGGTIGGLVGLATGALGVYAASARYPAFRSLSLPFRAFLVTSTGTFSAIVSADNYSRSFENKRDPKRNYRDQASTLSDELNAQKSTKERTMTFLQENKYSIVFGSWVASMAGALGLVGRSPYLSTQQKLVQARVYAQGLTMAVVILSLAFETTDSATGKGRWETVRIVDPNDPEHKHMIEKKIHHERYAGEDQWRDMVDAEERRIQEREEAVKAREEADHKKKGKKGKVEKPDLGHGKPEEAKDEKVNAP